MCMYHKTMICGYYAVLREKNECPYDGFPSCKWQIRINLGGSCDTCLVCIVVKVIGLHGSYRTSKNFEIRNGHFLMGFNLEFLTYQRGTLCKLLADDFENEKSHKKMDILDFNFF